MVNWQDIDTVLLDMDGTLLDLHFDNHFWLHYLPKKYASTKNLSLNDSKAELKRLYHSQTGTLNWYCLDYWSKELALNIIELKHDLSHLISYRPHTEAFLVQLGLSNKKRILITNAHPDSLQLKLKHTSLRQHLDVIYSSHSFDKPKEDRQFWPDFFKKERVDLSRTLLIDDSIAVLDTARDYGFQHLLTIEQPDSQQAPKPEDIYSAVSCFTQIMPNTNNATPPFKQ